MRSATILVASALAACSVPAARPEANEIIGLEGSGEAAECEALPRQIEVRSCYRALLDQYAWQVMIYHALGITGDNETFVPDHEAVLQDMVESCDLGRTMLTYATDGVAYLQIGAGGLSEQQIACVRGFERPGLHLQETMAI